MVAVQELYLNVKYNPLYWACACLCVNAGSNADDLLDDEEHVNFTDCLENAKGEMIEKFETNSCDDGELFVINYYLEDGVTLYKSVPACTGVVVKFDNISKDGYRFKGWQLEKTLHNGIKGFYTDSNNNYKFEQSYIFDEDDVVGSNLKLIAVIENIS